MMHPQKKQWLAINVLGGIAVLGSYAHGLITHPQTRNLLWGDMPEPLRNVYGVTMWLATSGYLVFTSCFESMLQRSGWGSGLGSVSSMRVVRPWSSLLPYGCL